MRGLPGLVAAFDKALTIAAGVVGAIAAVALLGGIVACFVAPRQRGAASVDCQAPHIAATLSP